MQITFIEILKALMLRRKGEIENMIYLLHSFIFRS